MPNQSSSAAEHADHADCGQHEHGDHTTQSCAHKDSCHCAGPTAQDTVGGGAPHAAHGRLERLAAIVVVELGLLVVLAFFGLAVLGSHSHGDRGDARWNQDGGGMLHPGATPMSGNRGTIAPGATGAGSTDVTPAAGVAAGTVAGAAGRVATGATGRVPTSGPVHFGGTATFGPGTSSASPMPAQQ